MNCLAILVVSVAIVGSVQGDGEGGSKCQGTNCTPAPGGTTCEPKYERDDGCCPVWHCANGQTAYGNLHLEI